MAAPPVKVQVPSPRGRRKPWAKLLTGIDRYRKDGVVGRAQGGAQEHPFASSSPYHHYPLHVGAQPPQLLPTPPAGPVGQPKAPARPVHQQQLQLIPSKRPLGQLSVKLLPPLLG